MNNQMSKKPMPVLVMATPFEQQSSFVWKVKYGYAVGSREVVDGSVATSRPLSMAG